MYQSVFLESQTQLLTTTSIYFLLSVDQYKKIRAKIYIFCIQLCIFYVALSYVSVCVSYISGSKAEGPSPYVTPSVVKVEGGRKRAYLKLPLGHGVHRVCSCPLVRASHSVESKNGTGKQSPVTGSLARVGNIKWAQLCNLPLICIISHNSITF